MQIYIKPATEFRLREVSKKTSVPMAQILEDALNNHFGGTQASPPAQSSPSLQKTAPVLGPYEQQLEDEVKELNQTDTHGGHYFRQARQIYYEIDGNEPRLFK